MSLKRITTSGRFVPEIDGLRFIAILAVVLYHVNAYVATKSPPIHDPAAKATPVWSLLHEGRYGVELFFVISGMILALPFARQHLGRGPAVRLKAYFLRRLTRLEPPYLLNLVLLFVLLVTVNGLSAAALAPHLLASATYVHNLVYGEASTINTVAWSLEIEVQFYLLAPLLTRVFLIRGRGRRRAVLVLAAAAAAVAASWLTPAGSLHGLSILQYLQYFLMGFLLADLYLVDWAERAARSPRWDALGVVAAAAALFVVGHPRAVGFALPVCCLALAIAVFRGRLLGWLFTRPWLTVLGGMCYTIYLYHFQVISFVGRRSIELGASPDYGRHLLVQALVIVPVVALAGTALYACAERPFMVPGWPSKLGALLRRSRR